jgi:DNA replication and repair protein RecF
MHIDLLKIENFRNIKTAQIQLAPRINLFVGNNGSGKTSLLEGVHVALTGRSQRRATNEVMLRRGADYLRVAAETTVGRVRVTSEYGFTPGRTRTLKINNNPVRALGELLEEFAVVSFAPDDLQLVYGAPSARRNGFDFVLSTASSSYLEALTDYQRAVAQKNRLLKDLQKTGRAGLGGPQLAGFNAQLVSLGVEIMKARHAYLHATAGEMRELYAQLADNGETVAAVYEPSVAEGDEERWAEAFEAALIQNSEKERVLGMAMVGPHRDDWAFYLGGRAARQFASQGQARSLAIALKLAGFRYLEKLRGETPILLFDEIFGELDPGRGRRLLELVGGFAQALITTVQPSSLDGLADDAGKFQIAGGAVSPL